MSTPSLSVSAPLPTADRLAPTLASTGLFSRLNAAVPRVAAARFSEAEIPALRAFLAEAERLCRPARPEVVVLHVERLNRHYPAPGLDEAAQAARWEDWIEDFADVPEDVLVAACRTWRRSSARFAPSPGQLLATIGGEDHWGRRRAVYARRAREVLALVIGESATESFVH